MTCSWLFEPRSEGQRGSCSERSHCGHVVLPESKGHFIAVIYTINRNSCGRANGRKKESKRWWAASCTALSSALPHIHNPFSDINCRCPTPPPPHTLSTPVRESYKKERVCVWEKNKKRETINFPHSTPARPRLGLPPSPPLIQTIKTGQMFPCFRIKKKSQLMNCQGAFMSNELY